MKFSWRSWSCLYKITALKPLKIRYVCNKKNKEYIRFEKTKQKLSPCTYTQYVQFVYFNNNVNILANI